LQEANPVAVHDEGNVVLGIAPRGEELRQAGEVVDGLNDVSSGLRANVSRFKLQIRLAS